MKILFLTLCGLSLLAIVKAQSTTQNFIQTALEKVPMLPSGGITAGQFSSHSEHQHNADYGTFLYKDKNGDAVIFDVQQPGCITNMWGTVLDSAAVLKFYFDGEEQPRYSINSIAFYKGEDQHFRAPLVSYDRRGYYVEDAFAGNSFAPVYFNKSLKISVQGKPTFYHILYKKRPFRMGWTDAEKNTQYHYLLAGLSNSGKLLPVVTTNSKQQSSNQQLSIAAYQSVDVLNYEGKGAVRYLSIEADTSTDFLKNIYVKMIWDEASDEQNEEKKLAYEKSGNNRLHNVVAPIGMFFCSPHFVNNVYSLPMEIEINAQGRMKMICRLPMPFWQKAHISLLNKSDIDFKNINTSVIIDSTAYPKSQTGYFTTFYHEGITEYGRDWLFCDVKGTGWFVGVVQSSYLEHYCEGNEHFYIDGNATPQINGTGTEDYYLGCFWPNRRYNTPFAGCVDDVRLLSGGDPNTYLKIYKEDYWVPATYYRFHLEMPIPFYSSMNAFIQHGAESETQSKYASLAYLYLKNKPVLEETDFIDVGNPSSRNAHAFQSKGTIKEMTSSYEGNYLNTQIADVGYVHHNDEISFKVAIPKSNSGIRLRRRTDQSNGPQSATVYVNDKLAGVWSDPQTNKILKWYDSEFDIPAALTQDLNTLHIKLVVKGNQSFTDFAYHVLAYDYKEIQSKD